MEKENRTMYIKKSGDIFRVYFTNIKKISIIQKMSVAEMFILLFP